MEPIQLSSLIDLIKVLKSLCEVFCNVNIIIGTMSTVTVNI